MPSFNDNDGVLQYPECYSTMDDMRVLSKCTSTLKINVFAFNKRDHFLNKFYRCDHFIFLFRAPSIICHKTVSDSSTTAISLYNKFENEKYRCTSLSYKK